VVLLDFDGGQSFGGFTGQRGFIGRQQCLTLLHLPRFLRFACAMEGFNSAHKKTAPGISP
jgi:hypothetical protein